MEPDYPAAHSMDTCFFAIDRDGHVACFDTGEAGAVPINALSGPDESTNRQLLALPRVPVLQDLQGHILPGRSKGISAHYGLRGSPHPILLFLSSLDPVREAIASGLGVQVPATEGSAVVLRELPEDLARTLHETNACLACVWHFDDVEDEEIGISDWATRGLFYYGHITENWISGPYGRERQPAQPIHVDQLPPQLRAAVKAMRFESLCFAETPLVQPVEHATCESWECAYVDAQYTTIRPIPGKEAEYVGAYEQLPKIAGHLRVEPPAGNKAADADE